MDLKSESQGLGGKKNSYFLKREKLGLTIVLRPKNFGWRRPNQVGWFYDQKSWIFFFVQVSWISFITAKKEEKKRFSF